VRLTKICMNESCSSILVGKHFSDMSPIKSGLIKEIHYCHCFSFFYLECALGWFKYQDGLKLNVKHQRLVYADGISILGGSIVL
jgi:hypothetical protein